MSAPLALDLGEIRRHPLPPVSAGDKDHHGTILIVAGSAQTPGSALLAAHGALRSGAGKLQIAAPQDVAIGLALAMPEALVCGLPCTQSGSFADDAVETIIDRGRKADAIVAGPGVVPSPLLAALGDKLRSLGSPLAFDAGMLECLQKSSGSGAGGKSPTILLPHAGELAALLSCTKDEVEQAPLDAGRTCAELYAATVLVKGPQSHIVQPDGSVWRYEGGSACLGISGSGDVLAGIVGGLLARGASPLASLLWGVWLHGEAGAVLARKVGCPGFLAREIPAEVPPLLSQFGC